MDCEKCKAPGSMHATKIFRFSGCLVAIGVSLLIPSLFALGAATFCGLGGIFSGGGATVSAAGEMREETLKDLAAIPGIPQAVVDEFEASGRIAETTLANLPPAVRKEVELTESAYHIGVGGAALGGTAVAGLSVAGVIATYAAGIPAFIIGFVLILRKKVWRCGGCGYVFERA